MAATPEPRRLTHGQAAEGRPTPASVGQRREAGREAGRAAAAEAEGQVTEAAGRAAEGAEGARAALDRAQAAAAAEGRAEGRGQDRIDPRREGPRGQGAAREGLKRRLEGAAPRVAAAAEGGGAEGSAQLREEPHPARERAHAHSAQAHAADERREHQAGEVEAARQPQGAVGARDPDLLGYGEHEAQTIEAGSEVAEVAEVGEGAQAQAREGVVAVGVEGVEDPQAPVEVAQAGRVALDPALGAPGPGRDLGHGRDPRFDALEQGQAQLRTPQERGEVHAPLFEAPQEAVEEGWGLGRPSAPRRRGRGRREGQDVRDGVIGESAHEEEPAEAHGYAAQLGAAGHGPQSGLESGAEREARLVGRGLLQGTPDREGLLAGGLGASFVPARHRLGDARQGETELSGAGRRDERCVVRGEERPESARQRRVGALELGQSLAGGRQESRGREARGERQHVGEVGRARTRLEPRGAAHEGLADPRLDALADSRLDLSREGPERAQARQAGSPCAEGGVDQGAHELSRGVRELSVPLGRGRGLAQGLEDGQDRHGLAPRAQDRGERDGHFFISKPSWASSMVSIASSSTVAAKSGPS